MHDYMQTQYKVKKQTCKKIEYEHAKLNTSTPKPYI